MLELSMKVFMEGFGFTRSFTHRFLIERFESLWVLRDEARKKPADYRREEWVACRVDPVAVDQVARQHTRGKFCVCALIESDEADHPMRAAYKALGYRFAVAEPLMVHSLKRLGRAKSPAGIQRVLTQELATELANVAGARQILLEHLGGQPKLRAYVATLGGEIVGWVRSVVCAQGNWCSNLFVQPQHRRLGIGTAVLTALLRDDLAYGAERSVLTASHAGAKLYQGLGYRQVGTILLFTPKA
jgi:GNAT superfamily N-acetyltransferase